MSWAPVVVSSKSRLGKTHYREKVASVVLFTGHEHDTETGLIYMKARFYDPDVGRFLNQDTYLGNSSTPPSLHRYLYAYSNPNYYIDPTGNFQIPVHKDINERAAKSKSVPKLPNSRRSGFQQNKFIDGLKKASQTPMYQTVISSLGWFSVSISLVTRTRKLRLIEVISVTFSTGIL